MHLEQIKAKDKYHEEKIRFCKFRIRENMWWTHFRQGRRSIVVNNLNDVIALDSSTKDINVEAKGRGLALVQLVSTFSTTSQHVIKNEFDVNAFNLEPRVEFQTIKFMSQKEVNQILVLSCQRWNCQKDLSVSGPAILTMKVPTGYMMDSEELSRIKKTGYNAWVENGKVVIFFHRVSIRIQ